MAIFHLHIESYKRSRGRTAVGGAAYRRGLKTACRASGKRFNFRTKAEVAFSELLPAQNDTTDYSKLENLIQLFEAIEQSEKHPCATLGREIEAALPNELTILQKVELVRSFVKEVRQRFGAERTFFDFSIHAKANNHHVHICMGEREQISPLVFEKTKRRDWDGKEFVRVCREIWQTQTNYALTQAGINQSVDCRSHKDRGIKLLPSFHEGKAAYFKSEVKKMNEFIQQKNDDLIATQLERTQRRERIDQMLHPNKSIPEEMSFVMHCAEIGKHNTDKIFEKFYGSTIILNGLSYVNAKHPTHTTLHFKDRSKVIDFGNRVESIGAAPDFAADRLVALALAKQWSGISFEGNEAFIRAAFLIAMEYGLNVVPRDAEQQKILDELRTKTPPASATGMSAPVPTPKPNIPPKPTTEPDLTPTPAPAFLNQRMTTESLDEKRKNAKSELNTLNTTSKKRKLK
jgi:hypothetical protein